MARTTGGSGFKMKSGNGPLKFKNMGSSPVKATTRFPMRTNEQGERVRSNKLGEAISKFASDPVGKISKFGSKLHKKLQAVKDPLAGRKSKLNKTAKINNVTKKPNVAPNLKDKIEVKTSNNLTFGNFGDNKNKNITAPELKDRNNNTLRVPTSAAEKSLQISTTGKKYKDNWRTTGNYAQNIKTKSKKVYPGTKVKSNKPGALEQQFNKNAQKKANIKQGPKVKSKGVLISDQGPKTFNKIKNSLNLKTKNLSNIDITGKKPDRNPMSVTPRKNNEVTIKKTPSADYNYTMTSNNKTKKVKTNKVKTKKVRNKRNAGESQYQADMRIRTAKLKANRIAKTAANKKTKAKPVDLTKKTKAKPVDLTKKTGLGPRA